MVSREHFLTEIDLHLLDFTFVRKEHKGLRCINESLFPIIAPRLLGKVLWELQGPTAFYTDGSKSDGK
jgi:hypothetical protein